MTAPLTPYEREERACDARAYGAHLVLGEPAAAGRVPKHVRPGVPYRWLNGRWRPTDGDLRTHLRATGHMLNLHPASVDLACFATDSGDPRGVEQWLGPAHVGTGPSRTPGHWQVWARVPYDAVLPAHATVGGCEVDVIHRRKYVPSASPAGLDAMLRAASDPLAGRYLPAEKIAELGPPRTAGPHPLRHGRRSRRKGGAPCAGLRRCWRYTHGLDPASTRPGHRNAKLHEATVLHFAPRPGRPTDRQIRAFRRRFNRLLSQPLEKHEVDDPAALRTVRTGIARKRANPAAYGGSTPRQRYAGGRTRGRQRSLAAAPAQNEAAALKAGGLSTAEIARRQGCSRSTVRRRIAAALKRKARAGSSPCIASGHPPPTPRRTRPQRAAAAPARRATGPP